MSLLGYLFDSIFYTNKYNSINAVRIFGINKKNWQILDIVDCVETCKQGPVLLVGGLTDEEQNNVATSLTVT